MIPWFERTPEEKRLLNPAFCAQLIWRAARGYHGHGDGILSLEEAFLVLPLVLHGEIRRALPRNTRTSMAAWLEIEPLMRRRIVSGARLMVPFTKEALLFAGTHGFVAFSGSRIRPVQEGWAQREARALKEASDEVRDCARRAEFVGKWMAHTGSAPTVLALFGVRP